MTVGAPELNLCNFFIEFVRTDNEILYPPPGSRSDYCNTNDISTVMKVFDKIDNISLQNQWFEAPCITNAHFAMGFFGFLGCVFNKCTFCNGFLLFFSFEASETKTTKN